MTIRNSTIDVAKGLGIILVVFGHNWIVLHEKSELFRVIFSFHMPLFFFLSGIFLRSSDGISHFLQMRAGLLLKPYFVVLTIVGVVKLLKASVLGTIGPQIGDYFIGMLYGTGNTIIWAPLWFLPHLFVTSTFSLVVLKTIVAKGWVALSAVALLMFGIYFMDAFWYPEISNTDSIGISGLPGLPWSIDLIPVTSSMVIFGYLLGDRVKLAKFNAAYLILSVLIFSFLHYFYNETIDLNLRIYGNAFISTIQAIFGIYIAISSASFLQKYSSFRTSLGYIGSGSLFILVFHVFFQDLAFGTLSNLSSHPYFNGVASLGVAIAMPLLVWEFVKRQEIAAKWLLPLRARIS